MYRLFLFIFSIPIIGGEKLNDEINTFLRSKKILDVEGQLVTLQQKNKAT